MHQEDDFSDKLTGANLSEEEKRKLREVMERAKEFDSSNQFNEPLEGVLLKWVNLMKGYQPRYFVLDPVQCSLYYYMVNSSNGITYKLKASNSKERQKWISH